ncbi:MAG: transporter, partial [Cyanobacteria bacterium RYN_339]|nr:transporter [Cyanobacteria bacterium RYN_339]
AIFGTLLTHHLAVELPRHLPPQPAGIVRQVDLGQLQAIAAQDPHTPTTPEARAVAEATKQGFSAAIAKMFGTSLWIIVLGFLVTLTIPALAMRERVPHSRLEEVEEALAGQALPAEVDPGAYPRTVQPPRRPDGASRL